MERNKSIEVIAFFKELGHSDIDISTSINNDLGLYGDDADYVLEKFHKKFKVNFDDLIFNDYFLPELVFKFLYYKWFKPEKLKRPPLTIGHLVEVVKKGYWFNP